MQHLTSKISNTNEVVGVSERLENVINAQDTNTVGAEVAEKSAVSVRDILDSKLSDARIENVGFAEEIAVSVGDDTAIELNKKKCHAVTDMASPQSSKEIPQRSQRTHVRYDRKSYLRTTTPLAIASTPPRERNSSPLWRGGNYEVIVGVVKK